MNDKEIEEFEKFTKTSIEDVIRLAKEYKISKIKIHRDGYMLIKRDCQGEPCCGGVNLRIKDVGKNNNFYYCIGDLSDDSWVDKFLNKFHEWLVEIKKDEKNLIINEIVFLSKALDLFDNAVYYREELDNIRDRLYDIYNEDLNEINGGCDGE